MKKLLATFAVTTLLVILAVSAVSCVYQPDADKVIDIGALGEPIFADEFDTFDTDTWWSGDDGARRGGYWDMVQIEAVGGNPANPDNEFTWGGEITSNEGGKDFVSEFVIDYVRCYDVDEIPFVK